MERIFITGVGSGIGLALAKEALATGMEVHAVGREAPEALRQHTSFFFTQCDLSQTDSIAKTVTPFLQKKRFDTAILNAGMLGEIKLLSQTSLDELKAVMELNLWANKVLIDLLAAHTKTRQVVGISSGAAVNGSKGWGAYSLSKAALNMLLKVYAKELPHIHFTALAPGVIRTPMVEQILTKVDETEFPSAARLKNGSIRTPIEAAKLLLETFPKLLAYESGSFLDVRTMSN